MKYSIIREANGNRVTIRKMNDLYEAMSFVEHLTNEVKLAYTASGKPCTVKYVLMENY